MHRNDPRLGRDRSSAGRRPRSPDPASAPSATNRSLVLGRGSALAGRAAVFTVGVVVGIVLTPQARPYEATRLPLEEGEPEVGRRFGPEREANDGTTRELEAAKRRIVDLERALEHLEARNRALESEAPARPREPVRGPLPNVVGPAGQGDAPTPADLLPFEIDRLGPGFGPEHAAWLHDRFQEIHRRVLELERAADLAGRNDPAALEALERERAALWDELRDELPPDEYLAGLYAAGRANRVSVIAAPSAAPAGLRAGDVLLAVGTERIFDPTQLEKAVSDWAATGADLRVLRGGQELHLSLDALSDDLDLVGESVSPSDYRAAD